MASFTIRERLYLRMLKSGKISKEKVAETFSVSLEDIDTAIEIQKKTKKSI